MKRREQSQTEQLRRALSEREAQLSEAQARLAALEGSTSLQVGRALTSAAKRPGRGLVRLPRDLFRLWRRSGGTTQASGRRRKPDPVRSYETERQEVRLLSGTIGVRDERLAVAGVLSPEAAAAVEPYLRVVPLRPQDAQPVFESVDVDLVLVTASAALAGTGSAWAHTGDPAAADRTRALAWVLEAAAARGVPSVLIADAAAPPALARLPFDLVHQGDLGVPLHRFNPIAAEPERSPEPVLPVPYRPLNAVARRLVAGLGLRTADPHWEDLPGLLRSSAAVIAADEAAADRALACGARALLLGRPGDGERGPAVPTDASALRSDAAAEELARLRAAGPLAPDEVRAALRSVFLTDATPVRLAEVLGRLDLAPGSGGAGQPLAGRRTAVLAAPLDDTESLALADDLLKQAHPAAQVVVPEAAARFTGVERLRSFGLPVRAVPVPDGGGAARWAALAREADAPWSALWHGPRGEAHLADLVCAAECSGADAVGEAAVPGGDAVRAVGADQDYVFVGAVRPDLVRTALAARGIDPGLWNRHGARLLALGPDRGAAPGPEQGRAHSTPGTN
ncbi:hypothetical protein [Nocardiopsis composta]|uniref:Uncharacterized protein n=1 Tax=Nocardiopsis composta TaxID=157465 RepID=A0A7W8VE35_9ACTN|nr:hypothetical protein [Nocardiopsis composta]MBB5432897.1 hypothetical protein [Nocardiopsis composta]